MQRPCLFSSYGLCCVIAALLGYLLYYCPRRFSLTIFAELGSWYNEMLKRKGESYEGIGTCGKAIGSA